MNTIPILAQVVVSALLVLSGLLAVVAALGLLRLPDFFQRMHPPALANTLAAWCITLACIVHFYALDGRLTLETGVINILLAITAPVTTILLARTALFRKRQAGEDVPPPLGEDATAPPVSRPKRPA